MKTKFSNFVLVVVLASYSVLTLPLCHATAQTGSRGKRVQQGTKPSSGEIESAFSLRSFDFETVTVDSKGSVRNRRKGQAQYFTEDINRVSLEMVKIAGGTFLMGSPKSEEGRGDDEGQHTVRVPTFYLCKYEVTQAQWRAAASLPKVKRDLNPDPSQFKGDNLPVESVLWEDTIEFCERLAKATGRQYRLPSEAEWEYAGRAGTTTPFAFGDTITAELVNYFGLAPYAQASKGIYRERTTPVGDMGVANAFGLYDMHGNVWEWCQDAWHDNYNNAPTDGSAWERAGDPGKRVLRGGSCDSNGFNSRAAIRLWVTPGSKDYGPVGFRVALAARTR